MIQIIYKFFKLLYFNEIIEIYIINALYKNLNYL